MQHRQPRNFGCLGVGIKFGVKTPEEELIQLIEIELDRTRASNSASSTRRNDAPLTAEQPSPGIGPKAASSIRDADNAANLEVCLCAGATELPHQGKPGPSAWHEGWWNRPSCQLQLRCKLPVAIVRFSPDSHPGSTRCTLWAVLKHC